MDADDLSARPADPLTLLARQDLDPLSVAELDARIDALKAEIARCEARLNRATDFRATADSIFKR